MLDHRGIYHAIARVASHVNIELASFGLATDAQVLDTTADNAHGVTLKMGEGDKHISHGQCLGHVGLFADEPLRYIYPDVVGTHKTIGHNERTIKRGGIVAVALRSEHLIQGSTPAGKGEIGQSGGITDKWPPSQLLNSVDQCSSKDRPQVSGVVVLATV